MDRVTPPRSDLADLVPYDVPPPVAPVVLSANESPYNLPEPVLELVREMTGTLHFNRYPDPTAHLLRQAIALRFGLTAEHVIVGNGGDEILQYLMLAYGGPGRPLLSFPPSFAMYAIEAKITGTPILEIGRRAEDFAVPMDEVLATLAEGDFKLVMLCSPNNPTGTATPRADVERILDATDALVLVDEAYAEFGGESVVDLVDKHANLMVLRTFSKAFSMAGLRVGYALAQPATVESVAKVRLPYNVGAFSQATALAALQSIEQFESRWAEVKKERGKLSAGLSVQPDTTVFPSQANFLCVRTADPAAVVGALGTAGIMVRDISRVFGLGGCLRVTVGSPEENDALLGAWPGSSGPDGSSWPAQPPDDPIVTVDQPTPGGSR